MKQFRKLLHSDTLFFLIILAIVYAIVIYPLLHKIQLTPPNYVYTLSQGFYLDYDYYLAIMKQGEWQWLTLPPYTTEPSAPSFIHIFYLWIGKIGSLLHIPHPLMYYITMYTGLSLFLLCSYRACALLLPNPYRRIAFLCIIFASAFPTFVSMETGSPQYLWWTPIGSAYHRLTTVPHHMWARALAVLVVYYWIRYMHNQRRSDLIITGVLQVLGILIFPMPGLVVAGAIGLWIGLFKLPRLLTLLKSPRDKTPEIGGAVLVGVTILVFLFIYFQIRGQESWSAEFVGNTSAMRANYSLGKIMWEYVQAPGILWVFVLLGLLRLPTLLKSPRSLMANDPWHLILCLFLSPYLFMILADLVGGFPSRIAGSHTFFAAGLLAGYGILNLYEWLKLRLHRWSFAVIALACAVVFFGSLPAWKQVYGLETQLEWSTNILVPVDWVEASTALSATAQRKSIVLSREHIGALLPVFTDLRPFIAHADLTVRFNEKKNHVEAFYANTMTQEQAKDFLSTNHIDYVYWGWYEQDLGKAPSYGELLEKIYDQDKIVIYKVNF